MRAAPIRYHDGIETTAAHRPLGSLMRARLKTYQALSRFRHERNRVSEGEPGSIDDVPA